MQNEKEARTPGSSAEVTEPLDTSLSRMKRHAAMQSSKAVIGRESALLAELMALPGPADEDGLEIAYTTVWYVAFSSS